MAHGRQRTALLIIDSQLEPWTRPPGIQSSDPAWHEGPQIGQAPHVGPRHGWEWQIVLAENPLHGQRKSPTPDEGGMAGRGVTSL